MEENFEKIEADIRKIRYNLENGELDKITRLLAMNILRYDLSLIEERDKVVKAEYDYGRRELDLSESILIGKQVAIEINEAIRQESDIGKQKQLYEAMKETYYYLGRYLFEYYLPALEFGIGADKQFIAPRTSVLTDVAKEYSKFYYRTDRPVMTVSMPQRDWQNRSWKEVLKLVYRKKSREA